jgi:hypothetical protein
MLREIEAADGTDHSARIPGTVGADTYNLYSTADHLHPNANGGVNQRTADNYLEALSPR